MSKPNTIIEGKRVWVRITAKELDALRFAQRAVDVLGMEHAHEEDSKPFEAASLCLGNIISKAKP